MAENAYNHVAYPQHLQVEKGREEYAHPGEINTLVYYPGKQAAVAQTST